MRVPTGRTRWGVVLVVGVFLAAAVVPSLTARTVPGRAEAVPVPGPPAVGDCVQDPINPQWMFTATANDAYLYPQVSTGPCQADRYGEITALIANPAAATISISSNGTQVQDPNLDQCWNAGYRYVGSNISTSQQQLPPETWGFMVNLHVAATAPSARQQAAGQHWLACAVVLPVSGGDATTGWGERYNTPTRDAVTTGSQRNRVGVCTDGPDPASGAVLDVCTTIHQSEVFGLSSVGSHPLPRTELQAGCEKVIADRTGIPHFTNAGLTALLVVTDDQSDTITTDPVPAGSNLQCAVTGTGPHPRQLAGSLIALGNQPIPWA